MHALDRRWDPLDFFIAAILLFMLALALGDACAGDGVEPAQLVITNFRNTATIQYASSATYYEDDSVLLTNCVLYSGSDTNSAVQGLSNVTISVVSGNSTVAATNSGTAIVASNGTWTATFTAPSRDDMTEAYIQVTITDENTNSYTYAQQKIKIADKL